MNLIRQLLTTTAEADVIEVCIGLNWTAVVMDIQGAEYCGLASTVWEGHGTHTSEPRIPNAGRLEKNSGLELVELVYADNITLRSVGIAAMNSILQSQLKLEYDESNAEEVLLERGKDKRVAIVGRFPFTDRLQSKVGSLVTLEQDPRPGDLPASYAERVIPEADVVGITGMTLINQTIDHLLGLCNSDAFVMVLGPSAPLSPIMFDYGVDVISGAVVNNIDAVLRTIMQGGNFRQVHRAGVQLVNLRKQ